MKKQLTEPNNQTQSDPQMEQQTAVFAALSGQLNTILPKQPMADALEKRLHNRIHASLAKHAGLVTVRSRQGIWQKLTKGIRYKPLWQSVLGNSVLIEFSPGVALPLHRHNYLEEGIVLSGSLQVDDAVLNPFDYHISPAGSHHGHISSKDGGVAFLRGSSVGEAFSMVKEVLGGLLPKNQLTSLSIKANESDWVEVQDGVFKKDLCIDGETSSRFFRLESDTTMAGHPHSLDEECMMLSGDLFFGDILLQAGDYQLTPKGSGHLDIYTDTGALFFIRGAVQ